MPRRHRRTRNLPIPWTPQLSIALVCGPDPSIANDHPHYLDNATLRSAWALYAARVLTQLPAHQLWGWWAFDPQVPDDLRGHRPRLVPLEDEAAWVEEERALREARERWLAARRNPTHSPTP